MNRPDRWDTVDPLLFEGRVIQAALAVKAQCDATLPETIALLGERVEELRKVSPEKFTVSLDDYWRGIHT
ncbi:hypothetical protein [Actinorugispora endophytica]|uniref:Uncharacterized protein n=1 Tax=Actinorugispora endophytica TaxID=1605990 RepID=A0A4R6UZS4_9ACTN|nr:hypothetical protein [Actinorugispora endophytica]TDQ52984.1 hypothetical protein EV190_105101 [Actinorugispora endophytica]